MIENLGNTRFYKENEKHRNIPYNVYQFREFKSLTWLRLKTYFVDILYLDLDIGYNHFTT